MSDLDRGAESGELAAPRGDTRGAGCASASEGQSGVSLENARLADVLGRVAELLEAQGGSPFRVRAYRRAAIALRQLPQPVRELLAARGLPGLEELPAIGASIGAALVEYLHTGRLGLLEHLEGQLGPEALFASLPGIGEELARRIHQQLGVDTLEELEVAAHDGRLSALPGFGARRVQALRDLLATRLGRAPARRLCPAAAGARESDAPPLALLLGVDAEYRERAARGALRTIAPRRFNPAHAAWLPIWHTEREGWQLTVLFSNTALAHHLGTTHDWVLIHHERGGREGQCTVVTERRGRLAGRRVVRGRELECRGHYAAVSREGGARAAAPPWAASPAPR